MQKLARAAGWLAGRGPDLLLWVIWGCVIYNGFNAIAEYTNAHHLFPEPWGGYAMAITVDGMLVYAFMSFKAAPVMGAVLLGSAAVTTYLLQRWHAIMVGINEGRGMSTLIVAGIVPGAMVLVTLAWHRIRLKGGGRAVTSTERERPEPTEREGTDRTLTAGPVSSEVAPGPAVYTASERPTDELPIDSPKVVRNGHGAPAQRAALVLASPEGAEMSNQQVADAARVSERTVRNVKAALKRQKEGTR